MTRQEREKHRLDRERGELFAVMETKPGRAVLWRVLQQSGVTRSSFAGEETHLMAFQEGRRDIGLRLLAECLTVSAALYTVMQQEGMALADEQELEASRDAFDEELNDE